MIGLEKLEALQVHENPEIYQKALEIIECYFGTEDEENELGNERTDYDFIGNQDPPQSNFSF